MHFACFQPAKIAKGVSFPCSDGCFKMGQMLPLEVLDSAVHTEAALATHALLLAAVTRNSQKFPEIL